MSSVTHNLPNDVFPNGLRVLIIDDDLTSLISLERMLQACHYQVTKCQRAIEALSLLREHKDEFDIVISDAHMPDMDGLRLLEIIDQEEMDLPVVIMSNDDNKDVVMRVIVQGACDYLVKPLRLEDVKIIWQHVVRKQRNKLKTLLISPNIVDQCETINQNKPISETNANFGDKENCMGSNGQKDEEDYGFRDDAVSVKKPRLVWTSELHEQFVMAVNQIGPQNAVPKKILELMNVPGLTRENVASHLQKYRLNIRKENDRLYSRRESENLENKFSTTPLQIQDLNIQYHSGRENATPHAYAIGNQIEPSCSISRMEHENPNGLNGESKTLVDMESYYNYGSVGLILGKGQQVNRAQEVPTGVESEQDCSTVIQAHYPLEFPLTITDSSGVVNGSFTEVYGLELSARKIPGYSSFLSYEHQQFDQYDSDSQFDQDHPTSRLYSKYYCGQVEEKFSS